jgi:hypothetical protein
MEHAASLQSARTELPEGISLESPRRIATASKGIASTFRRLMAEDMDLVLAVQESDRCDVRLLPIEPLENDGVC